MSDLVIPNGFLTECFVQRYGMNAGNELHAFLQNLATITLPFDLSAQMRRWTFPAFTYPDERGSFRTFPGLPAKYYYFVPGSTYGGHNDSPENPFDKSFVASVDGVGFNFGCPLRLHCALTVLRALPEDERKESVDGLAAATKHIATVEELFAAGIWVDPVSIRRPRHAARKQHDWNISFPDEEFHLECKYVPALWPKIDEEFELLPAAFAAKAATQLPETRDAGFLNVLVVVGVCPIDDSLREYCARELNDHLIIDVLVYLSTVGEACVFSMCRDKAGRVQSRVRQIAADDFGGFSPLAFLRPEREKRQIARSGASVDSASQPQVTVYELAIESLPPRRGPLQPLPRAFPYRCAGHRRPSGEPEFTFIPPFVPQPAGGS